ncbi:ribonuclease H-like domain-containing protein [Tanacetum coccineum]
MGTIGASEQAQQRLLWPRLFAAHGHGKAAACGGCRDVSSASQVWYAYVYTDHIWVIPCVSCLNHARPRVHCIRENKTVGIRNQCNGLYLFDIDNASKIVTNSCIASYFVSKTLWHQRLGHPADQVLDVLKIALNLDSHSTSDHLCDTCNKAKLTKEPFPLSDHKSTKIRQLVHLDVWEPYKVISRDGFRYFLTTVDDFSRAVWVYMLKGKDDVYDSIISFVKMITNQFDTNVKVFRSDNGTEFVNNRLQNFLNDKGILHQTTCVYTFQWMAWNSFNRPRGSTFLWKYLEFLWSKDLGVLRIRDNFAAQYRALVQMELEVSLQPFHLWVRSSKAFEVPHEQTMILLLVPSLQHWEAKLARWWDLDIPICANIFECFDWIGTLQLSNKVKDYLEGVGGTLMWSIWSFRNRLIFSNTPPIKAVLWDFIVSQLYLWISSRNPKSKISWVDWLRNPIVSITHM